MVYIIIQTSAHCIKFAINDSSVVEDGRERAVINYKKLPLFCCCFFDKRYFKGYGECERIKLYSDIKDSSILHR